MTTQPEPRSVTEARVVRFDTDQKFWSDWWTNWLLYGTAYAVNMPEPRVVPANTLTIHEGPCPSGPAPAVVPDVEGPQTDAGRQLLDWFVTTNQYPDLFIETHMAAVVMDILAIEREARAEGRAALDVDTIEGSLGRFKWRLLAAQGTKRMFASALAAALDEALAQRDPAESQP